MLVNLPALTGVAGTSELCLTDILFASGSQGFIDMHLLFDVT